ncbi:ABC transporter permease [Oerskovia enterophila]|uniref:Transport permease protein n=1 Tax=Oerskovia enterophila TaxID=43678 RepID=A0ABX2Y1D9_9CELL|nr:ABC transporter permease [Oerskovia enterophila]OCI30348.1 ABC-2 type transporter [Oerskovia enterophila]
MTTQTATRTQVAGPRRRKVAGTGWHGLRTLTLTEARLLLRDPGTVFFALLFPTVLLVGVGFAIPGMREVITDAPPPWGGLTAVAVYVPVALATAVATVALTTMPVYFATFREKGVLRRLSTTPMRPQGLVGAHLFINLVTVCVAALLAVLVGSLVFDLAAPANPAVVGGSFLLGILSMFSLGMLIASRAGKASTASAIGMTLYFPMLFLAGMWTPGPIMPEVLRTIGGYTPLGAATQAMTTGWFEDGVPLSQLVVMAVWTVVLLPLAVKLFRWS